jgi:release factor glutamine methyltransferase
VTLRQAIKSARDVLKTNREIEAPDLESEILLRYLLKIDQAALFLNFETQLNPQIETEYNHLIERRLKGEPIAYITNNREFYGLDFFVDSRVLIPRPETELLVEEAIKFTKNHSVTTVADIGTGSGIIAISLAVNLPETKIYATDISDSALEVARINCLRHHVEKQVRLSKGDLLSALPEPVDVLIANLPYVTKEDMAKMPSAKFEPVLALDGGINGLDQVFRFCEQLNTKIKPGGYVLLEIGLGEGKITAELLQSLFQSATIDILPDLAGIERVVRMLLPPDPLKGTAKRI